MNEMWTVRNGRVDVMSYIKARALIRACDRAQARVEGIRHWELVWGNPQTKFGSALESLQVKWEKASQAAQPAWEYVKRVFGPDFDIY